jgi:hypothetical protein
LSALRLPKALEAEGLAAALEAAIEAHSDLLWPEGEVRVPRAELSAGLASALQSARVARRVVRGSELAERALEANALGLQHVDRKTGVQRGGRVSRMLVLADDGSQRFYRNVESLVRRHAPRVMALRVAVDERALGESLFGPGQVARLVLLDHKDAVAGVLEALASQWGLAGDRG